MEPGHEDREYADGGGHAFGGDRPQWSPVMKTGNTHWFQNILRYLPEASMEPGHEDREYLTRPPQWPQSRQASMEPGHEDREYTNSEFTSQRIEMPQWSPVMKTGNTDWSTVADWARCAPQWSPVMKTGNTRGYLIAREGSDRPQWSPVMKTGNTAAGRDDDRHLPLPQWSPVMKTGNTSRSTGPTTAHAPCLNGARS